jgi:hypothetical protein
MDKLMNKLYAFFHKVPSLNLPVREVKTKRDEAQPAPGEAQPEHPVENVSGVKKVVCDMASYIAEFKQSAFQVDVCKNCCKIYLKNDDLRCAKCMCWRYRSCSHAQCRKRNSDKHTLLVSTW